MAVQDLAQIVTITAIGIGAIYALISGWIWIALILFVVWMLFTGGSRGSLGLGLGRGRY